MVADISFSGNQWAEINQEQKTLCVEFYPRPDGEPWRIDYQEVLEALADARRRLTDNGQ